MEQAIAEDRPLMTARTRTILAFGLLFAYVALGTIDTLTVLPPTLLTSVVGGVLMTGIIPTFTFGSKAWKDDVFPLVLFSLLLGAVTGVMAGIIHYERPDLELRKDGYDRIASELRKRPELTPLLRDARADGMITNGEKEAFDEAVSRFDRDKALGK